MVAKTSTERGSSLRDRRTTQGLKEVRGAWAHPADHAEVKAYALKLGQWREQAKKRQGK